MRSPARRRERIARGQERSPVKVTVTGRADLDPRADFFATGAMDKLVYCASAGVDRACDRLDHVATIIEPGQPVDLRWVARISSRAASAG